MSKIEQAESSTRTENTAKGIGFKPCALAIAISGALCTNIASATDEVNVELDKLQVQETVTPDTNPYAVPGAPYLARSVSDARRTRSLADTPQTIAVLTGAQIIDSGRSDLTEILDAQPGITLGTGENGNAFGDRYIIRGHEARSDIFVDGLRDPGMTIRESFATEQVEISKGPSSSFAGRGTTGGAVNSATKRASTEYDFSKLSAAVGTDGHRRVTLDTNQVISYDSAVRANVLLSQENVPDRAPADRQRKGIALSATHQPSDDLEITADIYHFQGDDTPDLGTYIDRTTGAINEDVPTYTQNGDFLESEVTTATVRVGYEISPETKLLNSTRYGVTDNGYFIHGLGGTTAYPTQADANAGTNSYSSMALDNPHQGWQDVDYFVNQTSLITKQEIGGLNHEIVAGLEYSKQHVLNGTYSNTANGTANCWTNGRGGVGASYCVVDADGNEVANINDLSQREVSKESWDANWKMETVSLSLMDTVDLNDKWTAFGGVRYDYYDYSNESFGRGASVATVYAAKEGYVNGHLGASYKITSDANVYASFSTATNLNGGESDLGSSCGYGGVCADATDPQNLGDPERTYSLELGTKWRLNDDKLLLSASVFNITKHDVFESASGDSYANMGTLNTGKNRVQGVELGLAGNLTDKLSAHVGYTMMDAKVLASVNAANVGATLGNFAEKSLSVQLKYQATAKFAVGGIATYESERYAGQPDSAANMALEVPSYTKFDAFASYQLNRDTKIRLNVNNVFDKDYYLAAYRSGTFTYIGDARSAQISIDYSF